MRHSMYKGTVFKEETAPRLTFLCSDLQCLHPSRSHNSERLTKSPRLLENHSIVRCRMNVALGSIYMDDMSIPTTSVAGEI